MNINWEEKAWLEYLYWQMHDKKILKKINDLLKEIDRNGYNYKGKPIERRFVRLVERKN